jgi:hypothetical protein
MVATGHGRREGSDFSVDKVTFEAHANRWLDGKRALKPRTAARYRELLDRLILPVIGSLPLTKLRPDHVQDVLKKGRASGLTEQTALHIYRCLFAVLRQAVHIGSPVAQPRRSCRGTAAGAQGGRTHEARDPGAGVVGSRGLGSPHAHVASGCRTTTTAAAAAKVDALLAPVMASVSKSPLRSRDKSTCRAPRAVEVGPFTQVSSPLAEADGNRTRPPRIARRTGFEDRHRGR